jgi:hypothetical protein
MTQTTGGFSATDAKIEYSLAGSTWVDISGFANSLKPGPLTRASGARWTHDGDTAILTAGKLGTLDIDVSMIYTEGTGDAMAVALTQMQTVGGGPLYLRWSPKGGSTGESQFTTSAGVLKKLDLPATDTEDPKPCAVSFTVEVATITKAAIT